MKRLLTIVLAALCFAACTQTEFEEYSQNATLLPDELVAGFEGGDTRIQLSAGKTVWNKGDLVSVFYRSYDNLQWQFQGNTGDRTGTLKLVAGNVVTQDFDDVVIIYPYNADYLLRSEDMSVEANIPAKQRYYAGSYDPAANIMAALSLERNFVLKNICGWIRVELTGNGEHVQRLTLRGNDGEQLAGDVYISPANSEYIFAAQSLSDVENDMEVGGSLDFDNSVSYDIELSCGTDVTLSENATAFYFAVPPQTFGKGFTVEVKCVGYKPMVLETEESTTLERNHIKPMAVVAFEAEESVDEETGGGEGDNGDERDEGIEGFEKAFVAYRNAANNAIRLFYEGRDYASNLSAEALRFDILAKLNKAKFECINSATCFEAREAAYLTSKVANAALAFDMAGDTWATRMAAESERLAVEQHEVSLEGYRNMAAAQLDNYVAKLEQGIAMFESGLATIEQYQVSSNATLDEVADVLYYQIYDLYTTAIEDGAEAAELIKAADALAPRNNAAYKYLRNNPLELGDTELDWNSGVEWYGFVDYVEDIRYFYPVYPNYEYYGSDTWFNIYSEEYVEVDSTNFSWVYAPVVSFGDYNAENLAKYMEYLNRMPAELLTYIEQLEAELARFEAQTPLFKDAMEKAQAWAEAEAAYDVLVQDTTVDQYVDYNLGMYVKTTYGKYIDADRAYNGGVTIDMWGFEVVVVGTNDKYYEALDKTSNLITLVAALEEEYANLPADATDAERTELAQRVEDAKRELGYARDEEAVAMRLNEAAKAALDAAKAALDAQKEKVEPARVAAEDAKHAYSLYYDEYANNLGVEKYTGEWVTNELTWEEEYVEVSASATFENWTFQYEAIMEYIAYINEDIKNCEADYDKLVDEYAAMEEEFLANVEGCDEAIDAYNTAYSAAIEPLLVAKEAWREYDLLCEKYAIVKALRATPEQIITQSERYSEQILFYEHIMEVINEVKASMKNADINSLAADLYELSNEMFSVNMRWAEEAFNEL